MAEEIELLIVGAGWHGITMAKTYHEAYPLASILIVDSSASVGGTWAQERLYPSLRTNNTVSSFEFSDYPMDLNRYSLKIGDHIPGHAVHQYLTDAATSFDLVQFLKLNTKVETANLSFDNKWEITYRWVDPPYHYNTVTARKLVLAFGLTSEPFIPSIPGRESFSGLFIHSRELSSSTNELSQARNVLVLGSNKSSWDVCYTIARQGGKAHMIIRPLGGGPTWAMPKFNFFGKLLLLSRLSITRFWSLFDPWPFANDGSLGGGIAKSFLHRSKIGRALTGFFWSQLDNVIRITNRYDDDAQTKKLSPWSSTYWMGNSLSTLNYPTDWFEEIRKGRIIPHHDELIRLEGNTAILNDEEIENFDAIVYCTGWKYKPPIQFYPPGIESELGLPHSPSDEVIKMSQEAQESILAARPGLSAHPRLNPVFEKGDTAVFGPPYQLYRFMTPSSKRLLEAKNIAFIGIDFCLHTVILAQAQALWITAFMNDKIPHLRSSSINYKEIAYQTVLHAEYERLRRPRLGGGVGEKFPDLVFDALPYVDMLLSDLSLDTRRKRSWCDRWFQPYSLRDYKDLVQEWKRMKDVD